MPFQARAMSAGKESVGDTRLKRKHQPAGLAMKCF